MARFEKMRRKGVPESVTACVLMNTRFAFCGFYRLLNGTRIKVMAPLNSGFRVAGNPGSRE